MGYTAGLSSLPDEIIELIAQHLGNELKHLRLACRQVERAVFDFYKVSFFTEFKVFLATEASLRRAINVMKHPGLGPAVQKLVLVDDSIADPTLCPGFAEYVVLPEQQQAVLSAHRKLFGSGRDRILLSEVFRNCARIGKVLTIRFRGFLQGRDGPPRHAQRGYLNTNHCFINAMTCIAESNATFDTLSMDTLNLDETVDGNFHYFGITIVQSRNNLNSKISTSALNRFKTLDLIIDGGAKNDMAFEHQHNFLADIEAPKVRSLTFTPREEYVPYICSDNESWPIVYSNCSPLVTQALLMLELPAAEVLNLRYASVVWEDLLAFLLRHKALLTLTFECVVVEDVPDGVDPTAPGWLLDDARCCARLSELTGVAKVVSRGGNTFMTADVRLSIER
jgi:hypothetical protein